MDSQIIVRWGIVGFISGIGVFSISRSVVQRRDIKFKIRIVTFIFSFLFGGAILFASTYFGMTTLASASGIIGFWMATAVTLLSAQFGALTGLNK